MQLLSFTQTINYFIIVQQIINSQMSTLYFDSSISIGKLMNAWKNHEVSQLYQNIVLQYLDFIPHDRKAAIIEQQIQLIKDRKSFYYTIKYIQRERSSTIHLIEERIQEIQNKQFKTEIDVAELCGLIKKLRSQTLVYAESLMNLHHYYIGYIESEYTCKSMTGLFKQLDSSMNKLKASFMRKFIIFSKTYDPFLLVHYEMLQNSSDNRPKEHKCIKQLFQLQFNEVFRLKKMQKQIKQYLKINSKYKFSSKNNNRLRINVNNSNNNNDWQISRIRIYTQPSRRKQSQKLKLNNKIYLNQQNINKLNPLRYDSINDKKNEYFIQSSNNSPKKHKQLDLLLPQIKNNAIGSLNNTKRSKIQDNLQTRDFLPSRTEGISTKIQNNTKNMTHRSLSILQQRQKQFKNVIPKRLMTLRTISDKIVPTSSPKTNENGFNTQKELQNNTLIDIEKKQAQIQCQIQQKPQQKPQQNLQDRQQKLTIKPIQIINTQKIMKKDYSFKNCKLKAISIKIQQIFEFLSKINIKRQYRQRYQINNWHNSITKNQYYCHKFYVNQQLCAISLCCGLPQGDSLIKYWGPLVNCDQVMSNLLFSKYLQHLEKQTLLKNIYYNAEEIPQIVKNNFIMKKERIFCRPRVLSSQCSQPGYHPFLSIDFTIIAVSKSAQKQDQFIIQKNAQTFESQKFICFNYLLIINKLIIPGTFSQISTYHPKLKSMKECQYKMAEQFIQNTAFDINYQSSLFSLLTLKIRNIIYSAFFIAQKGYIKTSGQIIKQSEQTLIISLQMLKYNMKLYFGKGIKNAAQMVKQVKNGIKNNNIKTQFAVRMFSKQLCGQMPFINLRQQNSFGDLVIKFVWKDFLKGNIQHKISECRHLFDQSFYCLLSMEGQILFVFEIDASNFI